MYVSTAFVCGRTKLNAACSRCTEFRTQAYHECVASSARYFLLLLSLFFLNRIIADVQAVPGLLSVLLRKFLVMCSFYASSWLL